MITKFKIFELRKDNLAYKKGNLDYNVGDYVMYDTIEDKGTLYYGKVIEKSESEIIDDDDEFATVHYAIQTTEKIMRVWQTEYGGEIVGYWDITPEEKKNFELELTANKYNL